MSPIIKEIHKVVPIHMPKTKSEPTFNGKELDCMTLFQDKTEIKLESRTKDTSWLMSRVGQGSQHVPNWSGFHRATTTESPEVTKAGFLPIIQQPAHEYDTLNTVILRCMDISKSLHQTNTVITVDQALYCKIKELLWFRQEEFKTVIVRLGGLHITMNYLQCIGKHMESAGLGDIWMESGLYGESTIQSILSGKAYNRAVRAHKLTYEAIWRVYLSNVKHWLQENGKEFPVKFTEMAKDIAEAFKSEDKDVIASVLHLTKELKSVDIFKDYDSENAGNPTFTFWRNYMKMVETLLDFLKAERVGNWELHLASFMDMLPFFFIYDHNNYARWGPVYLADMSLLQETAPEVHAEFKAGNFVVKRSNDVFNQVSPDQAPEWLNRSCKVAGGLIGITRNETARDKWCLTYNEKAHIAECTRGLFNIMNDEEAAPTRNDSLPSGIMRDEQDVLLLVQQFERFKVFEPCTELRCISTNDLAPDDISEDLLKAEQRD